MWSVSSCTHLDAPPALGQGGRPPASTSSHQAATAARRAGRGALYLGQRRYTWAEVSDTAAQANGKEPEMRWPAQDTLACAGLAGDALACSCAAAQGQCDRPAVRANTSVRASESPFGAGAGMPSSEGKTGDAGVGRVPRGGAC
jgi:hypothetical protein